MMSTQLPKPDNQRPRDREVERSKAENLCRRICGGWRSKSIEIIREVAAEFKKPVMLYSIGKDSRRDAASCAEGVLPRRSALSPLSPCRHDLEIQGHDCLPRRPDAAAAEFDLLVYTNEQGLRSGIDPMASGSLRCIRMWMKTEALKQALDLHGFDAAFGGARRDEEKTARKNTSSRSARRITSGGSPSSAPRLSNLFNTRVRPGESIRVFPLSNWTELDIWHYIMLEQIAMVPLLFRQRAPGGPA